jgi:hypothetical protein
MKCMSTANDPCPRRVVIESLNGWWVKFKIFKERVTNTSDPNKVKNSSPLYVLSLGLLLE